MKRSTALIALGALSVAILSTALPGSASTSASARPQKVVVIGIDGALLSKIQAYNTPALKGLIASGSSSRTTLYAQPFAPTLSGPGWATNATGVWPDKHLVKSNSWGTGTNLTRYPDFLTRIQRARPALSTYAIADWTPLTTNSAGQAIFSDEVKRKVTYDGDALGWAQADARIATEAAAYLKDTGPDASFVYFGNVDIAGHSCGAAAALTGTLTFGSHYLKSGAETATVLVSFDGAPAVKVLGYTSDAVAKQERLTISVPAGARTAKITWSLANGDNDWYWAIDNPHFTKN